MHQKAQSPQLLKKPLALAIGVVLASAYLTSVSAGESGIRVVLPDTSDKVDTAGMTPTPGDPEVWNSYAHSEGFSTVGDYATDDVAFNSESATCLPMGPGCEDFNDYFPEPNPAGDLRFNSNDLVSTTGLETIETVGGELNLSFNDLTDVDGLSGLREVGGTLNLRGNDLTDLRGLGSLHTVGGAVFLDRNDLQTLDGLENLEETGSIYLYGNDLTDISALSGLRRAGGIFHLYDNPRLADLSPLSNIEDDVAFQGSFGGQVRIDAGIHERAGFVPIQGGALCQDHNADAFNDSYAQQAEVCADDTMEASATWNSYAHSEGFSTVGDYATNDVAFNSESATCLPMGPGCEDFNDHFPEPNPAGDLLFNSNDLVSTAGLETIETVGGELNLSFNDLTDVDGLSGLREVGGTLNLRGNDLTDLRGLGSLHTVGGAVFLDRNDLQTLDGLENLEETGSIYLYGNDLTDISALSGLRRAGGIFHLYDNPRLADLSPLSNIEDDVAFQGSFGGQVRIDAGIHERAGFVPIQGGALCQDHNADAFNDSYAQQAEVCADDTMEASATWNSYAHSEGFSTVGDYATNDVAFNSESATCLPMGPGCEDFNDHFPEPNPAGDLLFNSNDLVSTAGLETIETVGGELNLSFNDLTDVDGLSGLREVGGTLNLRGNDLTDLRGLGSLHTVGGAVFLDRNDLQTLDGLENLEETGSIYLYGNDLTDISALSGLRRAGGIFHLYDNPRLADLSPLSNIEDDVAFQGSFGGQVRIDAGIHERAGFVPIQGGALCQDHNADAFNDSYAQQAEVCADDTMEASATWNSYAHSEGFSTVGDYATNDVAFNSESATCLPMGPGCEDFNDHFPEPNPAGDLLFNSNDLVSTAGLETIETVGGELNLSFNDLTDVDGLSGLREVGGTLNLRGNDLTDLRGLGSLHTVGGAVFLDRNDLQTLDGLENLEATGRIYLYGNDLTDISALSGLRRTGNRFHLYDNPRLADLSPLSNIEDDVVFQSSFGGRVRIDAGIHERAGFVPIQGGALCQDHNADAFNDSYAQQAEVCADDTMEASATWNSYAHSEGFSTVGDYATNDVAFNSESATCLPMGPGCEDFNDHFPEPNPAGDLLFNSNDLVSTAGLETIETVGGELNLSFNDLTDVDGLSGLREVGGTLNLRGNDLTDLRGLGSLHTVGGAVFLDRNDLQTLDGLENLEATGRIYLYGNDLTDISALSGLRRTGNRFHLYDNPRLADLSPLSNIEDDVVFQSSFGGRVRIDAGIHERAGFVPIQGGALCQDHNADAFNDDYAQQAEVCESVEG
ncbi:hypothetical protein TK90_2648 (plasmid) [Thioalkalivibrio sp. K90mix]|uniref:hypothetical protein n=1 Tax=Thioalkalivibrio sp. (strain K90mix) TaxID=396595 RepID=UPI0001C65CB8|nr:hypothetical protein [Thioalkalivibrio sp. K90mix]ADC73135.1 hypothetical protein TK90_2648 [Thioalkalivibrio sp. K90mix]